MYDMFFAGYDSIMVSRAKFSLPYGPKFGE